MMAKTTMEAGVKTGFSISITITRLNRAI